jgi:subtilase family serine protease
MRPVERHALTSFFALAAFAAGTALAGASTLVAAVPQAVTMHDLGHAAANVKVHLAVVMNYRNEAQLDQLLDEQADESSPLFERFLSQGQFTSYFSPSAATYARTVAALQHAGFTVTTWPNRTVIDATGPAPVVDRYFQTDIHRVSVPGDGIRYANARPALMPLELRGAVFAILGFDDIQWARPQHVVGPRNVDGGIGDTQIGAPLRGPNGSFGPLAFAQGYDFPVQHQIAGKPSGTTYDGTGQIAGIEIPGDPTDSDLNKFLTEFKVTRTGTTNRVPVDGGPQDPSFDTLLEAALDYETISSLAPGATVDIFEFPGFDNQEVLDGYQAAVNQSPQPQSVNSSFGACETANIFNPQSIAKIFKQGAAEGMVFHASSGDSGTFTYGCSSSVSILTPADTPFTTAIGGTALTVDANGNYTSEIYWNSSGGAGGGGVSKIFKLPKWQRHVKNITKGGRNEPDISFDASPSTGIDIVFEGQFLTVGGTSLASPIFGACTVELEQVLGKRIKTLDKLLYNRWRQFGYSSGSTTYAHDITGGQAFGILKPGPGYDLATGIGSLDCFTGGQKYL